MRIRAETSALDVLRAVNGVADRGEFPTAVLRALRAAIPYDVGSYNEVDRAGDRIVAVMEPADFAFPPGAIERFTELVGEHPLVRAHAEGNLGVLRISDVIDRPGYRALALYREVYGPLGVEFQVGLPLPAPPPVVAAFALSRRDRDFTDEEVALLAMLQPHLSQTFVLLRRLELLRDSGPLGRRADRRALIVVDPDGAVEVVDAAPGFVERVLPTASTLRASLAEWVAGDASRAPGAIFVSRGVGSTLTGRVTARRATGAVALTLDEVVADAQRLAALGLTTREAEILARMIGGAGSAAAASDLGISKATVDKHLERVYRKLGVSDRADAVAAALRALLGDDDPPD